MMLRSPLFLVVTLLLAIATDAAGQTGLVAAYGFDEASGVTITDASGNGNAGTLSSATRTTAGRFGSALIFNGTSSVVRVPDSPSLDLTTRMTVEAWVFPLGGSKQAAIFKELSGGAAYALYASENGGRPSAHVTTTNDRNVSANVGLPPNTWSHLATTYDGATLRLFVNGIEAQAESVGGAISVSTGILTIGANLARGEFFNGRMDDVRVYNRALSAAEIRPT